MATRDKTDHTDQTILALCGARDPQAVVHMQYAYGSPCYKIALNILRDHADAEECVNDAYLAVWQAAPAAQPQHLFAYLAKTTRNIALQRLAHNNAQKRGAVTLLLDELAEVLPSNFNVEDEVAANDLIADINHYLKTQTRRTERQLFLRRYFWGDSIADLRQTFGYSESKIKSQLHRTRQRLRTYLKERGYGL